LHVPIYCWPKKNNKQISLLFPFPFYSKQQVLLFHQASFIHDVDERRFLQTEGGGQEGKMHFFFFCCFFEPAGRRGRREGGPGRTVIFADIPVRL
jgi:hypothetical protein